MSSRGGGQPPSLALLLKILVVGLEEEVGGTVAVVLPRAIKKPIKAAQPSLPLPCCSYSLDLEEVSALGNSSDGGAQVWEEWLDLTCWELFQLCCFSNGSH